MFAIAPLAGVKIISRDMENCVKTRDKKGEGHVTMMMYLMTIMMMKGGLSYVTEIKQVLTSSGP